MAAASTLFGLTPGELQDLQARAAREVRAATSRLPELAVAAEVPNAMGARETHARLARCVRQITFTANIATALGRCQGEAEVLDAVLDAARLLGYGATPLLLLADAGRRTLACPPRLAGSARMAQLALTLEGSGTLRAGAARLHDSALARAWSEHRVTAIEAGKGQTPLYEVQLLRVLVADWALAVPLVALGSDGASEQLGLLVIGAWPELVAEQLSSPRHLLGFGERCAQALWQARQADAALGQAAQQVATQARLASRRVAHEINNPLAIIKNYLSLFQRQVGRQHLEASHLAMVMEEVERIERMVGALGESVEPPVGAATDVPALLDGVVRTFRDSGSAPASITFRTDVDGQVGGFEGDAQTLRQVLVNLIKNAIEAMPTGGFIEIRCNGAVALAGRRYIELWLRDNGPGLPAHVMAMLFSGTPQPAAPGPRGLGLQIVQSLMQRLGGLISCRSGAEGTSFQLLLPASSVAGRSDPRAA